MASERESQPTENKQNDEQKKEDKNQISVKNNYENKPPIVE